MASLDTEVAFLLEEIRKLPKREYQFQKNEGGGIVVRFCDAGPFCPVLALYHMRETQLRLMRTSRWLFARRSLGVSLDAVLAMVTGAADPQNPLYPKIADAAGL